MDADCVLAGINKLTWCVHLSLEYEDRCKSCPSATACTHIRRMLLLGILAHHPLQASAWHCLDFSFVLENHSSIGCFGTTTCNHLCRVWPVQDHHGNARRGDNAVHQFGVDNIPSCAAIPVAALQFCRSWEYFTLGLPGVLDPLLLVWRSGACAPMAGLSCAGTGSLRRF